MHNISYKSINAHVIVPATYKKSICSFLSINIMFKTCIFSCLCLDLSRSTYVLSCYCIFRWHFKDFYIFRYFFLSVENVLETSGTMNDFYHCISNFSEIVHLSSPASLREIDSTDPSRYRRRPTKERKNERLPTVIVVRNPAVQLMQID